MNSWKPLENYITIPKDRRLKTSIQAFLSSLIDYAGLFPPASLPLDTTVRNYKNFQVCKDSWMLGNFIIPAVRIDELALYAEMFSEDQPLTISTVGSRTNNRIDCLHEIYNDLKRIKSFSDKYQSTVKVNMFEMSFPPMVPDRDLLETIAVETGKYGLKTFCEATIPLNEEWESKIIKILDVIAEHNIEGGPKLGFKLRTGGVTSDAFPTPEQVATVLIGCRDRNIALKFTAGLHHPIRMYRKEVNTQMHGFLNVFTAGMLANVYNLNRLETAEILADDTLTNFAFTNEGLSWGNLTISISEILSLREKALCSYGSCSFDEPRDELRALEIYHIMEGNLK
ncbi:hypothetical protein ACH0BK_24550 [Priestia megaterium]|uniref:hypothetical protein n=1 Tax=Priestia megaterium TaxID=1404 RepID=UPI001C2160F9|nr:hypothetical protein [Priestia megaterium]MBU8690816.1 hypothetical protein [Priestia megaterium]